MSVTSAPGASAAFHSIPELREKLDDTPLAGGPASS